MKLHRIKIENMRSFLEPTELHLGKDISIIIGPNGGGKTNLLDIATISLRKHLLLSIRKDTSQEDTVQFSKNNRLQNISFARHNQAEPQRNQVLELELEVTQTDLDNMKSMQDLAQKHEETIKRKYVGLSNSEIESWDLSLLSVGQRLEYQIVDERLDEPTSDCGKMFRNYLARYEVDASIRAPRYTQLCKACVT